MFPVVENWLHAHLTSITPAKLIQANLAPEKKDFKRENREKR